MRNRDTKSRLIFALVGILTLMLGMPTSRADDETPASPAAESTRAEGVWTLITVSQSRKIESTMTLTRDAAGGLAGTYVDSRGGTTELADVALEGTTLKFVRMVRGRSIAFEATIKGDVFSGHHVFGENKIPVWGGRGDAAIKAARAAATKEASRRSSDPEEDYRRNSRRVVPRDRFPVLHNPEMVKAADSRGVLPQDPVIGVNFGGEARAYPVAIMGIHELVNDICGEVALAASW